MPHERRADPARRRRRRRPKREDCAAGPCGQKYPAIARRWRKAWRDVIFLAAFRGAARRIIAPPNATASLTAKLRRAGQPRGHFPPFDNSPRSHGHLMRFGHPMPRQRSFGSSSCVTPPRPGRCRRVKG
ncbi:MAG: transposase [Methylocella sp.]